MANQRTPSPMSDYFDESDPETSATPSGLLSNSQANDESIPLKKKRITRDQRIQIELLHRLDWKYQAIADYLKVSLRGVQWAITQPRLTPQHHRAGRRSRLQSNEIDLIENFIKTSKATRQMPYWEVAITLWPSGEISEWMVKNALNKRGYNRRIALKKPVLSDSNRKNRLEFAKEHENWTIDQWSQIIWSDETWVTSEKHRKTRVTRKLGESLIDTCLIEKERKPKGWMLWGCFHGSIKGPHLFWEKDWGSINQYTYCAHTIPLIDGYLRWLALPENGGQIDWIFIQDNAPGHAAQLTKDELAERGITLINWPPFSPDLNPIETVWNRLKDWLNLNYPNPKCSYDILRKRVNEAWATITPDLLKELIESMPDRMKAVIEAGGGHTKY